MRPVVQSEARKGVGNRIERKPDRTKCSSRRRLRSWFFGVHWLATRPPLLSFGFGPQRRRAARKGPDVNAPSKSASGARRRVHLLALLTVLVVAAVCAAMVWPRSSAITRENEARIHEGMSWDELKVILGGPPRDESTGPTELDPGALAVRIGRPPPPSMTRIYEWISDEVLIRVAFDANGRAEWITTCPMRRTFPGVVPTVRHWLRRLERGLASSAW